MNELQQRIAALSPEQRELLLQRLKKEQPLASEPAPIPRRDSADQLPLSFAQQRLWFLDQLEPNNPFYNIPLGAQLEGPLNVEALKLSFNEIVRYHESLRTSFEVVNGQPAQVVHPAYAPELPFVDLRELEHAQREAQVQRLADAEALQPFDLAGDQLFRITLVSLAEDSHLLLLTMHHIISDGWSKNVLLRDLALLYEAYSQGQAAALPELPIQYADYALWQREQLQGEALEEQLQYWKQQLGESSEVLELPTDHPRPANRSYRGIRLPFALSAELTEALKELSRSEGVTPFMLLTAAFQTLLHRYSQQQQITIGTPVAGRTRTEVEPLIGFFVNTLVLRTDFGGDPSFAELLQRVKKVALGAYAHQEVPFEKLVEELEVERSLSHTPLFQTMLVFENNPASAYSLSDLGLSVIGVSNRSSIFDLTLYMGEEPQGLTGAWEYSTELFEETTIRRMMVHFERLLESVVAEPQQRVSRLGLLSEAEREQLLVGWNQTARVFEQRECVHQLIAAQAARQPDAVAVSCGTEQLTYGELNTQANQLAHYLRELGVGPETIVGVSLERSVQLVVTLLGIWKAGGAYLPLDPEYPEERLRYMVENSGAPVLIREAKQQEQFSELSVRQLVLSDEQEAIERCETNDPVSEVGLENLAYVIYTSGSTGQPKGVMVQHGNLLNFLLSMREEPGLSDADRLLAVTTFSFDIAGLELWLPLLVGGHLWVAEAWRAADPVALRELLRSAEATVMQATPVSWRMLLDAGWRGEPGFKVLCGGEALSGRLAAELLGQSETVWNLYGPTETTIWSTRQAITELARELEQLSVVPLGRGLANTQVYVLDHAGEVLPAGVAGELYLGGAGVARGYLGRAAMTAERFVPDPYGVAGSRLYRTGDLVRWTNRGQLEFIGRRDEQIKLRGFRIELGEIETALRKCSGVRQAIALVRKITDFDQRLVAYVVPDPAADVSVRTLREQLQGRLPEYMMPAEFLLLDELPLTPNGKIDRRALAALQHSGSSDKPFEAPRTPVEEMLAGIWAELLRVERVGANDSFFELGGHSLLATQLVSRVREVFHVEISLRSLFEQGTLADLGQKIEAALRAGNGLEDGAIVPIARDGALPLSFAQQRLWFLDQLEPGTIAYNMPVAVRLGGPLQVDALERALNEVIRRHEVLRTSFGVVDGGPAQIISDAQSVDLGLVDLSHLPEDEANEKVSRLMAEEGLRPFNLSEGRLLRVGLIRLQAEEHVLLLTMHHIVSDGWSMGVLVGEVSALYEAFSAARPSPLEELKIQYVDFAHWQRQWLSGDVLDTQLDYWRQQLNGAPPVLELPTDRPRPAVQTLNGAAETSWLPTELSDSLKELSRQEGATLFMALLAAFQLLLSRYSGHTDIVVGSAIANRNRAEIEPLIGFFINSLVLRTRLDGDPTFRELLHRVRETALGAYAHQDLPFEMLVEHLQPQRDLSRSPLFQVMFTLQNTPHQAFTPEDNALTLTPLEFPATTAKFDFEISVTDFPQGLAFSCEYNTDLFDAATIKRMLAHLGNLLRGAAADPGRRISELPLLSDEEQRHLLMQSTGEVVAVTDDCFEQLLAAQIQRRPQAVALSCGERAVTYGELGQLVDFAAKRLIDAGVSHETVVGLLCERSIEWIVSAIAIMKSGGVYLPLDARHPAARLAQLVQQGGARLVVAHNELAFDADDVTRIDLGKLLGDEPIPAHDLSAVEPSQLAYIIFTSGSTGAPKGAMVEQRGMLNHLVAKIRELGITESDCLAQTASPSFDISVWQMFAALATGGRVEVFPDEQAHDPVALLREVERAGVTVLELVPSMLRAVLQELREGTSRPSLEKLRWLMVTGEVLEAKLCRQWLDEYPHVPLINAYGPTECSDDVTHEMVFDALVQEQRDIPLGHVLNNLRIYVLNGRGELLPEGVWGELYVSGAGVGRGYVGRADLTAERFVPDEYSGEPGARMYRTGDVGRWRGGKLEYSRRVDEQVKVRGQRIELGEVESVLSRHESVRECAVIVRDDLEGHKQLTAYVVAHPPSQQADEEERRRLEEEKVKAWETVFDDVYEQREVSEREAAINLKVWISSYTREALPEADIFECFEDSVARILRLQPKRLLELGCGTGLLLTRIAPHCEYYCGADISAEVIGALRNRLVASNGHLSHVDLQVRAAHDFDGLPPASFDLVVLNELAQYFPSIEYLVRVLEGALTMVRPGGAIFIGGVRNLQLLEAFHLSVLLHQSAPDLPLDQLRERLRKHVQHEKELVVDPDFFHALKERFPVISDVQIELKGGRQLNELTKFRYDVVLRVGPQSAANGNMQSVDWTQEQLSIAKLQQALNERKPAALNISNVPNERVAFEAKALEFLASDYPPANVGLLRAAAASATGEQPHQFWSLVEELPYTVEITWASERKGFGYDVLMRRRDGETLASRNGKPVAQNVSADPQAFSWRQFANNPLRDDASEKLIPVLRRYMQERVPEYMVPATFMMLDRLPLTANGKLDRRSLPVPDSTRHDPEQTYVEPGTSAEETLARIWCEVLGLEQVGIHDNFFALGGDSILSIQIVSRAARAGLHLTPKELFQHQTVAALAAVARTTSSVTAEQGIITGDVPLTPVQHWFFEREVVDQHHYNQAVMLAVNNIDATLLRRVVTRLVEHHDALRLRYEQTAQGWQQRIVADDSEIFSYVDLSEFAPEQQAAKIEAVANEVQASLNLSEGPVARVALLDLGAGRGQRLLLVIHHLAVDGVSWRILLEDLQSAYEEISRGAAIQLPPKTTSIKEWSRQLGRYAHSEAVKSEASHWLDPQRRLVGPLPLDHQIERNMHATSRVVSMTLSADETRQLLHEVPGVYHTQTDEVLLAAVARAVTTWTKQEQILIDLEGHGREAIDEETDVTRTVGWFTAIYPVLLSVAQGAGAGESLKAVKEQLRKVPQRGVGYGLLRYLSGDAELTQKLREIPDAQMAFNYLGQFDQVLNADSGFAAARESSGESRSTRGEREYVLEVVAGVSEGQLHLTWVYSEALHRRETIEQLARDCQKELREIIKHCQSPEAGGFTPSDFPLAEVDQDTLDRVMAAMNKRTRKVAST